MLMNNTEYTHLTCSKNTIYINDFPNIFTGIRKWNQILGAVIWSPNYFQHQYGNSKFKLNFLSQHAMPSISNAKNVSSGWNVVYLIRNHRHWRTRDFFFLAKRMVKFTKFLHSCASIALDYSESFILFSFYEKKKQKIERVNHSWKVKAQSKIWCYKWDGKKSAQTKESETQIIIQKNVFSSFQRCVDSILTGNVIERHRMHGQIEFNTTAQQKV